MATSSLRFLLVRLDISERRRLIALRVFSRGAVGTEAREPLLGFADGLAQAIIASDQFVQNLPVPLSSLPGGVTQDGQVNRAGSG
jgi:hypothetical protein